MELQEPIIKSNALASISQMILNKDLYRSGWIYNFFGKLIWEEGGNYLTFLDYKFFWQYGIQLKRYFEYPFCENYIGLSKFIAKYLKKGYFIISYLNSQFHEKDVFQSDILFYDIDDEGKFYKFCEWNESGEIFYRKEKFEDIFFRLYKDFDKEGKYTFDLQQIVPYKNLKFDKKILKEELSKAHLNFIHYAIKFIIISVKETDRTERVFKEWITIYKRRLKFLKQTSVKIAIEIKKFENILYSDMNKKRKVGKLINKYNKLNKLLIKNL